MAQREESLFIISPAITWSSLVGRMNDNEAEAGRVCCCLGQHVAGDIAWNPADDCDCVVIRGQYLIGGKMFFYGQFGHI